MKNEITNREGTERLPKKLTGSLAAKIVAICLIIVSVVTFVASAAAVIVSDYMNVYTEDERSVLARCNERMLDRYSVYAIVNYMNENEEALEKLDQTNFRYGIIRTDDFSNVDLNDKKSYLIGNIDKEITLNDVNLYSCNWGAYTGYDYDMSLFGYAWINNYTEQGGYTCESQVVDGYFYDWMNETLYIKVGERFYPYSGEILVSYLAENLQEIGETTYTVNGPLDNSYLNGDFNDWRTPSMMFTLTNSGQYLRASDVIVVDDQGLHAMGEVNADGYSVDYVSAGTATVPAQRTDAKEVDSYYIVSYAKAPLDIKENFDDCDLLAQVKLLVDFAFAYKYVFVAVLILSVILAIAAFVFLLCAAGHRNGSEELCKRPWDAIPLDVNICGVLCLDAFLVCAAVYVGAEWNPLKYLVTWLFAGAAGILTILLLIECSMSFALWCKLGKWWQHTLIYAVVKWCWKGMKVLGRLIVRVWKRLVELARSVRFLWKAWLLLGAIACIEFLFLIGWDYRSVEITLMLWFLEKLVLYPIIIFALLQLNRLQEGSKKLAQGDLTSKIDTSKMYWEFKQHGENLNAIGDGMNAAVNERMKSERFKTELITNVSHDIKTPLTSIINYVDLLEKEQIDDPKVVEYLEVLSRQSARLKKLIEDLIEASKASTGNLKVDLEPCDAKVTLVQTIGEYEEKLASSQIELHVKEPDEPVKILADSRHLWRIFDNLMNNICKYAQPGTRAYVNLERTGNRALVTFRNISKEALNISSEELMERFVRGDSSRSMEGNGLGLSIARSLTELMGGTLELVVDGDLFKVVLSLPVCDHSSVPEWPENGCD